MDFSSFLSFLPNLSPTLNAFQNARPLTMSFFNFHYLMHVTQLAF